MSTPTLSRNGGALRPFVTCSAKHKHCSRFHAALVRGYQVERERQEIALEAITGGHSGDREHWAATGGRLIDFKQWLIAHRQPRRESHVA